MSNIIQKYFPLSFIKKAQFSSQSERNGHNFKITKTDKSINFAFFESWKAKFETCGIASYDMREATLAA